MRFLIPAGLALAGGFGTWHFVQLERRASELERTPRADPVHVAALERELERVRGELEATRRQAEDDRAERQLSERLRVLESRLLDSDCRLEDQVLRLSSWEQLWQEFEPTLDTRIDELSTGLEQRWRTVDDRAASAEQIAREDRDRLENLRADLARKPDKRVMWDDLMGPVVQLAGDSTVGSGVLLESRPTGEEGRWNTHLLTAWHVVRDIYGSDATDKPVPVKIYLEDGTTRSETAHLLAQDARLDIALLVMDTQEPLPSGARLASRARLSGVQVFDPIYAVGCPLGNDPIPTAGEVAATQHEVDGASYWMISAPTYIGNSGGGIFDSETHELLAIFSKIYTHGSLRSTIVPHMGLATPLTKVYDWLEREGYAEVEPAVPDGQAQMAAAAK